jgi:Ca-activated chloride channel homolog
VSFAAPYLLVALVAVPLVAVGYELLDRRRSKRAAPWSRAAMLPNIVTRPPGGLARIPIALLLIGTTLLLVGFAKPQRVLHTVHGGSPTIVLTFDVSGSMASPDIHPTRIEAARKVALRFLQELPTTYRVALVTFGNDVHVAVAPTLDRRLVIRKIPRIVTPLAGTAIGDAVAESVADVVTATGASDAGTVFRPGAIVLFSDGAQTAGGTTPSDAAATARVNSVPIDTVGIGTSGGSVIQGSAVLQAPVMPATLQTLSKVSGGTYVPVGSAAQLKAAPERLKDVYANLRPHSTPGIRTDPLSAAFAAGALVFILAGVVVSSLWFGRIV